MGFLCKEERPFKEAPINLMNKRVKLGMLEAAQYPAPEGVPKPFNPQQVVPSLMVVATPLKSQGFPKGHLE